MIVINTFKALSTLIIFTLLSACATTPMPPLTYNQGAVVQSLSTGVSLSMQSAEQGMAGSGFMVYRRPDKVHLIILSPFGTTLFEVFTLGDQITLVYPSQGIAYSGHVKQLPEKAGSQGWHLMRWVMDSDPLGISKPNGTYERRNHQGQVEKITVEQGLITTKANPNGDQVYYGGYSVISGVPIAAEIEIHNKMDDRIRIKLQEPEINIPLDDAAFVPRLDGLKLLPLSAIESL
jgi:outer membrane biogenesis lipoprotein LolB